MKFFVLILLFALSGYSQRRNICVDPSGTGDRTQGYIWASAVVPETLAVIATPGSGSAVYFHGGTYTLTSAVDLSAWGNTQYIGVLSTCTDTGVSVDSSDFTSTLDTTAMPIIVGDYAQTFGDTCVLRGIGFKGDVSSSRVITGDRNVIYSCYFVGTGTASSNRVIETGLRNRMMNCIVYSAETNGVYGNNYFYMSNNYVECPGATDGIGMAFAGSYSVFSHNLFKNCGDVAVKLGSGSYNVLENNTYLSCNDDVKLTTGWFTVAINESHPGCSNTSYSFSNTGTERMYNNHVESLSLIENFDTLGIGRDPSIIVGVAAYDSTGVISDTTTGVNPLLYRNNRVEAP